MTFEDFLKSFKRVNQKSGYKNTVKKEYVLKALYHSDAHLSPTQIYNIIKKEYRVEIAISTIYKFLAFLEEYQVVNAYHFDKEGKKYELNLKAHHDHIVCTRCNQIIEFSDETIERYQKEIAQRYSFNITNHTFTIYGVCDECSNKK